ncbi:MAG: helix-turn-helix domain-containing protein [Acholeplasmatales bacterium]|nr:helix-turn-helix domain-containing protein [Acholeplasmatales bacterium]
MTWSEGIKKLRKKLLITQKELADMLGISFASVNRYENGVFEPTMRVKRMLKKLFDENGIIISEVE